MLMPKIFKRSSVSYGLSPQPVTPYQRAAQVWDDRMGSARVQARNWRLMAFGSLALSFCLGGTSLWLLNQSRVTPYVIQLSGDNRVLAVEAATKLYHPSDAQVAQALARFITDVRGLSTDPVVVRRNWLEAYDWVTAKAAATLNDYASKRDPFGSIGKHSSSVDIISVVRSGPDSFEVRWRETAFEQGVLQSLFDYTALLGVALQPPTTEDALKKNPLGIYITSLNWSKDLQPQGGSK